MIALAGAGNAVAQLVIDDFSQYANTNALQANWSSFGGAATSGPPVLAPGAGVDGGNAAQFSLNWGSGNNGNMRLDVLPEAAKNLSGFGAIEVTLRLETRPSYTAPSTPTKMRLVIQGVVNGDSTIWQMRPEYMVTPSVSEYTTVIFNLDSAQWMNVDGTGSFADTLANLSNIRLRFENGTEAGAGQFVFVDSIVAVPQIPEASTYALATAFGAAATVCFLRRRRRACR